MCPTCLSKRSGNNFAPGIELKIIILATKMRALAILLLFALFRAFASSNDAYPSGYGDEPGICLGSSDKLQQREGEIIDITHPYTPNTPVGDSAEGAGQILSLLMSMKNGSDYNLSEMRLCVHAGTHVDAPGHMYDNYFDQGFDVDTLDLRVLNGRFPSITALISVACFFCFVLIWSGWFIDRPCIGSGCSKGQEHNW